MELLRAVYWIDDALQSGLRARGHEGVTRSQSLVLVNIHSGVDRPQEIASNLGVTSQAMSQTLAAMTELGLITIAADPNDRRARVVKFSSSSAALRADALAVFADIETELQKRIGPARFRALRDALTQDWGPSPFHAAGKRRT
jgi:DNA-binding MarR family transcriptional regulator